MFPGGEIRAQILLSDIIPPVISGLSVSATELWPPNNKMRNVTVSYSSTDNFPGAVTCNLSVSSNEPVTSKTDKSSPDWVVVNNNMVQLRAERAGSGSGRIYTITVTCTDLQGNSSSSSTTVEVKHDQSGKVRSQPALNDLNENSRLGIAVYPNPARHSFTIQIQDNNLNGKTDLRLFDIAGKLIESRNNISSNQNLQIGNNLKAGVYILELRQASQVKQFRLVKSE
ncbi:MAG: T9SS type A sorting domain-containing protein [Bacteroidota bacterium]|nr:T9SS type A sorting domain-containing protein [Bacteroidota bacterium]